MRPPVLRLAHTLAAALALACAWPAWSQLPPQRIPGMEGYRLPTMGEMLAEQARELGSALDTRNQLARQRAEQIGLLTERLAACGNCAERSDLQQALSRWQEADRILRQAERGALSAMGLGQYGSIDELQEGMARALAIGSQQVEYQRRRERELGEIAAMVGHECRQRHAVQRPPQCAGRPLRGESLRQFNEAVAACQKENDVLRLYANEETRRQLCTQLPGDPECGPDRGVLAKARAYNRGTSAAEREARADARSERLADQERLQQAGRERSAQRREERQRQQTMTASERRDMATQRNAEMRQQALDRQQQRRECDEG